MNVCKLILAGLFASIAVAAAAPAFADGDWGRHERHEWRERAWREHEWREHHWRERFDVPPFVAAPGYYAPPPVYYANPGYYR